MIRALANVLLLHWPGLSEQRWDERQKHLSKFLRDITEAFRQTRHMEHFSTNIELQRSGKHNHSKNQDHQINRVILNVSLARSTIIQTLQVIGDLVENVLNELTQTKKLCYNCTKDFIDIALWLFPIYVNDVQVGPLVNRSIPEGVDVDKRTVTTHSYSLL